MAGLCLSIWCFVATDVEAQSDKSDKLVEAINAYRMSLGLHEIAVSRSLTKVAQVHAKDLLENNPDRGVCNMHSWSEKGDWSSCCYKDVDPDKACMWDKPREIAGFKYQGNGYEIVAWLNQQIDAEQALALWKESKGHHDVILNRGSWNTVRWRAIGAAILGNYAVVWFGTNPDSK